MFNDKVIHEPTVFIHRLSSDATSNRGRDRSVELWHIGSRTIEEFLSRHDRRELAERCFHITGGKFPEPPMSQDRSSIFETDLPAGVVFAPKRQERVRSDKHFAIHTFGQMHPEERIRRIRDRIDETVEDITVGRIELSVLPKERHNRWIPGPSG